MIKKYIIEYKLVCETGLSIQAGNSSFEIGGVENSVIKNPLTGQPYIPGSSLKGKLRSLLEWFDHSDKLLENNGEVLNDSSLDVCKLFGIAPAKDDAKTENGQTKASEDTETNIKPDVKITRVLVRDAYLTQDSVRELQEKLGENIFTEVKAENTINRLTSKANPRFFERVPKGAEFEGEIIFTVYENEKDQKDKNDEELLIKLITAMELLEDNYLGGSGSRGAGKVKFKDIVIRERDKDYYLGKKEEKKLIDKVSLPELKQQVKIENGKIKIG